MFCDRCGAELSPSANFCSKCGKAWQTAPVMPVRGRLAGHIRLLGIFWIALSAIHLIPGIVLLSIFSHRGFFPPEVPGFVPGLVTFVGWAFLAISILGFMAGWGLLQRELWARTLALVMGCVSLLNIPFGTALGIYTLWVLLPAASEQEYKHMAETP